MNERASGVELLRIISIIFVISGHIFPWIYEKNSVTDQRIMWVLINSILVTIFGLAVPLFMSVTSYFGVKHNVAKVYRIWLQVTFYSMVDFVIRVVVIKQEGYLSFENIIKSIFPLFTSKYWYATTYICVVLLFPYMIEKIDKKMVGLLLFLFILLPSFFYYGPNGETGKDIVCFFSYYVIIQYLKNYTNLLKTIKTCKLNMILGLSIFVAIMFNFLCTYYMGEGMTFNYFAPFVRCNSITMFIAAISMTELFARIKWNSRIVNWLAKFVFATYIFEGTLRVLLNNIIMIMKNYDLIFRMFILISFSVFIFFMMVVIENIRKLLFDKVENVIIAKLLQYKIVSDKE